MKTTFSTLSIFLAAGLLAGCGGGSPINSGVDESKPANEVTNAEAEDICEATAEYAASKVDQSLACKTAGFAAGLLMLASGDDAMQEACQDAYDTCVDAEPEEPEEPTTTNCDGASAESLQCDDTVTVGEVQTCLADKVDAGASASDVIPSCSQLTLEYLQDLEENPPEAAEEPASCDVVADGCPGYGD